MATTLSARPPLQSKSAASAPANLDSVPWYIWALFAAVVSVVIGGYWDISWHMSIGRDSFWTPAHIAIQMCGALAGLSCGYLILSCTLGTTPDLRPYTVPDLRPYTVKVWGFRGPLGAFIAAWGGAMMLTSAPFDNWWHNAYGLDVKIFSPPHVVLDGGVLAIQAGTVVLIASTMNRSSEELRKKLDGFLLLLGGMIAMLALTIVWESTYRVLMHTAECYRAVAVVAPVVLTGFAAVSRRRWARSIVAGIYTAYAMVMLWIFPLFPATPKLGPVYQKITHMVPMEFPLLLIVPALCLDAFWPALASWKKWPKAAAGGAIFLAAFLAAQWPFATFLVSSASANWFFGTKYFAYFASPNGYDVRHMFFHPEQTALRFGVILAEALLGAILSTRLGLAWGEWVRDIRR
jgi:hypothetical protein